jgi:hypothetical protein
MEGANAVLRKPLDRDEVVSVIQSLIGLSHTVLKPTGEDTEGLPTVPV